MSRSKRLLPLFALGLSFGLAACDGAASNDAPAPADRADTSAAGGEAVPDGAITDAAPAMAGITVADVWARESPMAASMGAVYMRIDNGGTTDDALVGAAAAVASTVEVHETTNEGGVMSMAKVDTVPVPAGGTAEFKPGGYHIMLIGVATPLKAGERFPVTLMFANAGVITVEAEVRTE